MRAMSRRQLTISTRSTQISIVSIATSFDVALRFGPSHLLILVGDGDGAVATRIGAVEDQPVPFVELRIRGYPALQHDVGHLVQGPELADVQMTLIALAVFHGSGLLGQARAFAEGCSGDAVELDLEIVTPQGIDALSSGHGLSPREI